MTKKYTKGKQFESPEEMLEWLKENDYVIQVIDGDESKYPKASIDAEDIIYHYEQHYQAIEQEETKEYWLWDYCDANNIWVRTIYYYSVELNSYNNNEFTHLKNLPDNKKRRVESSKLILNSKGEMVE